MENNLNEKLERFGTFWSESLQGNYQNGTELRNLARQIRDAECTDEFLLTSLSKDELTLYNHAVTFANAK